MTPTMPKRAPRKPRIHTPLLEDATAHGHGPGDEALAQLQIGDCVAVMVPFDAPTTIIVRVVAIEKARTPVGDILKRLPEILVGRVEDDQVWGPFFATGRKEYLPGAMIRFGAANIARIY